MEIRDMLDTCNSLQSIYTTLDETCSRAQIGIYTLFSDLQENFKKSEKSLSDAKEELSKNLPILNEKSENLSEKIHVLNELIRLEQRKIELQQDVKIKQKEIPKIPDLDKTQEIEKILEKIRESESVLSRFEEALGLKILRCDSSIRFIFSHITCFHLSEHFVELKMENESYWLIVCSPSIKDVDRILEDLNKTHDLTQFLKSIRNGFKMLYN